MSNEPTLTIAGNNDLASETARHAIASGVADPVYLWKSIDAPLVSAAPALILADADERAGFARAALGAGIPVVSLPIDNPDDAIVQAMLDGRLRLMSRLHGLPALDRLYTDCEAELYGRRYGVFAAHRLPRNAVQDLEPALCDLVVYVASLIDSPLVRLSATTSNLDTSSTAAWFLLARFADDTIATIEVGAMLPEADDAGGELLVEVTGSDAVLRAEPERQSILVNRSGGHEWMAWYAAAPEFLLRRAVSLLKLPDPSCSRSALHFMQRRVEAAKADRSLPVSPDMA